MTRVHSQSAGPWLATGIGLAVLFVAALAFSMTSAGRRLLESLPAPSLYTSANR